ncbi:hypothetical protein acsn021_02450 [Anaerocolumna cellulosilytica]|uniref:Uncharacterized protein n=1 Tax=Anaerocolumna cellulosilytica TaxID=433286 RepID=A0A6S6QSR6_9FIRM|nr:hypothetical protein acsn021_02450 [Anaerocolumna cellulosilytica]
MNWLVSKMLKVNHDYRYESGVDYYTGRVVGDVLSMLGGSGSIVSGIGTIVTSITGGGAITVSSGGTLVLGGGAIVVEGVIAGTAQVTYGGVVLEASAKNFGNDLNKLREASNKGGFKFPKSNSDMKKVFGVNDKVFHKQIKPEIIRQINKDPVYSKEFRKMGNNPDIGVDDFGNIVLKDVRTQKTLQTNWSFKSFIP